MVRISYADVHIMVSICSVSVFESPLCCNVDCTACAHRDVPSSFMSLNGSNCVFQLFSSFAYVGVDTKLAFVYPCTKFQGRMVNAHAMHGHMLEWSVETGLAFCWIYYHLIPASSFGFYLFVLCLQEPCSKLANGHSAIGAGNAHQPYIHVRREMFGALWSTRGSGDRVKYVCIMVSIACVVVW